MKQAKSIPVAQNITLRYFVSTAMWATSIPATGMIHPTYETFVWEWKGFERKKRLKAYYHDSRKMALEFHFRFCRTLAARDLMQVLENDHPFHETP